MASLFSPSKPAPLPAVTPAPTREDPAIEEARRAAIVRDRKAKGRASTIITGGVGVTDAPVELSQLLGA